MRIHIKSFIFLLFLVYPLMILKGQMAIELTYTPFKDYAYVQTDYLDNRTSYSLTYDEPIKSAEIRPYSKNVKCEVKNKSIEFSLPSDGHYIAYVNGFKIIIFAQKAEKVPSGKKVVNAVIDLKINNTGKVNQTKEIADAIDKIAGSGKTLFFPKGTYLTSQFRIIDKNNLDIYIEKGAVILADTTTLNYKTDDIYGKSDISAIPGKKKWTSSPAFVVIDNSKNVSIRGYGMFDGQGRSARRNAIILFDVESAGRYRNFLITRSDNVLLEDIISADPGVWNTHILHSKNVTCLRVKQMNELKYNPIKGDLNRMGHDNVNTDGFDPDASQNVLIKDCFGYCADDNVAIKTSQYSGLLGDVDGVTVEGCVFLTQKSSLKVGTETGGMFMKNIIFRNNDVVECDRAISVYCFDGAEITAIYENNRIETNIKDTKQALVYIELKPRVEGSRIGKADIQIKNTSALMQFPKPSRILYTGENSNDLKVTFTNFTVAGQTITDVNNDIFEYKGDPVVSFR